MTKFNNFTIQDEKGKSYSLLVQRALYQSLPKHKKQINPLLNTITETEDFKAFQDKVTQKQLKPQTEEKKLPNPSIEEIRPQLLQVASSSDSADKQTAQEP